MIGVVSSIVGAVLLPVALYTCYTRRRRRQSKRKSRIVEIKHQMQSLRESFDDTENDADSAIYV